MQKGLVAGTYAYIYFIYIFLVWVLTTSTANQTHHLNYTNFHTINVLFSASIFTISCIIYRAKEDSTEDITSNSKIITTHPWIMQQHFNPGRFFQSFVCKQ